MYADISRLWHESARKWGVPVLDGTIDERACPYPKPAVVETLRWQSASDGHTHVKIDLVTLNDLWSYTVCTSIWGDATSYAALLKFCDPYPTRGEALDAAIARVYRRHGKSLPAGLVSWLKEIAQPVQLGLFGGGG